MQTRGEIALVDELKRELGSLHKRSESPLVLLNLGAGSSVSIEDQLGSAGFGVICDRVDVEDPAVDHPMAGNVWRMPAYSMPDLSSGRYPVVFANYVFEHIERLDESVEEVGRVLTPNGLVVLSIPTCLPPSTFSPPIRRSGSTLSFVVSEPGSLSMHFAHRKNSYKPLSGMAFRSSQYISLLTPIAIYIASLVSGCCRSSMTRLSIDVAGLA